MALRYRKSIKLAPGVRLNVNAKSVGVSVGCKGFRKSINSSGRVTTTVSIPGTGISSVTTKTLGKSSTKTTTGGYTSTNRSVDSDTVYTTATPVTTTPVVSSKSKKTALLSCIFGGWCGIHYFYVGRIGKGLLYLFTFGLFCIGWFYDIYPIVSGKFKDSHGSLLLN